MNLRTALLTMSLFAASMEAQPARRALLIGIDDYSASTLPRPEKPNPDKERGWPDLKGAANDVGILEEMLVLLYGFERKNIVTLENQQATRAAILQAIEQHLVAPARNGDVVFYYFAGHGAQVPNPASEELDRLDESIVPADSRWGAEDIRDKELRPLFNRILDRGAHLTLILDHCHSGSSFRGLPNGARPRGIGRARPVIDAKPYGPRPEERGALVLAATQDLDSAWEMRGDDGVMHGAFTWAWIRAMRDAVAGEPAQETFLRAQARLRAETPFQAPAMLGSNEAKLRPFLGVRIDRQGERPTVAVEKVEPDGDIVLQGGWANGLAVDTTLSVIGQRGPAPRLRVTQILGLGRSIARIEPGHALPGAIRSGALVEVVGWAAPHGRPMRVWAPHSTKSPQKLAQRIAAAAKADWVTDPLEITPTHFLRPRGNGWELLEQNGNAMPLAHDDAAISAIARLRAGSSLFVQFPAPASLTDKIGIGDGVVRVDDSKEADYLLVGRFRGQRVEYAWMRPLVRKDDRRGSGLPQRTAWRTEAGPLRHDLMNLRRIHAWHALEAPPNTSAPYRLALRDEKTRDLVRGNTVFGSNTYSIVLRAAQPLPAQVTKRYYYVFVIDSHGKSYLVFPRSGSVENRFPIHAAAPTEIPLGNPSAFAVLPPYGIDTYFLLSTEEPLPNPDILQWDGVRAARALTMSRWSIERVTFESVEPAGRGAAPRRARHRK